MENTARPASAVRAEMARRRITQAQLAQALGISQPAVSRRLRGETAFDADELIATARLLGCTVARLFDEEIAA